MAWRSKAIREVVVYKSTSHSIWDNLAFEDWIFKHVDLSFRRILFLWRNSPCVVIGRHQNPWLECNVPLLVERGIELARRRSGGGTVYHDLGNLNVTMFSHRDDYDRPRNLQLVCSALNERWNTQLSINKHNDIICRNRWKVSGSSSKLAKSSTYHHFTLLLHADTGNLHQYLSPHPNLRITKSTATQSRRSEVINLSSLIPSLSYESVCSAISSKFYDVHGVTENREMVSVDTSSESILPGITDMNKELQKWVWNFGKTPKFTCTAQGHFHFGRLDASFEVVSGVIADCSLSLCDQHSVDDASLQHSLQQLQHSLTGCRLWRSEMHSELVQKTRTAYPMLKEVSDWLEHLL